MKHYVYKISNIIENKHYIGARSAKNPNKDLGIKYFSSSSDEEFMLEQQEFPERFEYNILEVFSTRKDAINKEIELHNLYDVAVNESFYNRAKQTSIGFCRLGTKLSEEHILKISQLGRTHTKESKIKMSKSHMGKNHSEETRGKMSESRTGEKHFMWGNTHSQETKDKISATLTGKPLTEEHRIKIKEARNELSIKTAYRFIVYDKDNNLIHDEVVINFREFCLRNNYTLGSFGKSHRTNEPIKGGKFKGWRVERYEK